MQANPTCYAYHFDEPSTYDNEWGGLAHHSLENIYIWNVLRHTLSSKQQIQAKRIANLWLSFAAGRSPWPSFGDGQNFMVFGEGEAKMLTPSKDSVRGYEKWNAIRHLGGKDLIEAWGEFAYQLCILKRELLDPHTSPKALEVGALPQSQEDIQGPGVL